MNTNVWELNYFKDTILCEDCGIKVAIICFGWIEYCWKYYITKRQIWVCKNTTTIPEELKDFIKENTFFKTRQLAIDNYNFSLKQDFLTMTITTAIIFTGAVAKSWNLLDHCHNEVLQNCAWIFMNDVITGALSLIVKIYTKLSTEQNQSIHKHKWILFLKNNALLFLAEESVKMCTIASTVYILQKGGRYAFIQCTACICVANLFYTTTYLPYVSHLFMSYNTLPVGEIRDSIKDLAKQLNISISEIYVLKGNKKVKNTAISISGIVGSKQVILYDTLFRTEGYTNEEILALLAHEFGHYHYNHKLKFICLKIANISFKCFAFFKMIQYSSFFEAMGFKEDQRPIMPALVIFIEYVLIPYNNFWILNSLFLNRHFELEADKFVSKIGKSKPFKSGLLRMQKNSLQFPVFDPLYSAWNNPYPQLIERLNNLID